MDKDQGEEGEGEINGYSSMKSHTLTHMKYITNGNLKGNAIWDSATN